MALLLVSALVKSDQAIAYPLLLIATAFVGAGRVNQQAKLDRR